MERFDVHVAESKRNLTTKDTKNRENRGNGLSDEGRDSLNRYIGRIDFTIENPAVASHPLGSADFGFLTWDYD
jgi:hypothetical protein